MDKQQKIAIVLIPLIAIVLLAGGMFWKQQAAGIPSAYVDGTYEGVGKGYGGNIKVSLTISNGDITNIELIDHSETPALGDSAALKIIEDVMASQSTEVDTVSGATASSNGTIEAINMALAQASGGGGFTDGIHEGVAQGYGGDMKVKVEVSGGKIVSIEIVEINETPGLGDTAAAATAEKIIDAQSFNVDVTTGATKSSEGLIAAVKNALGLGDAVETVTEPILEPTIEVDIASLADGIYTGSAEGYKSDIELSVTVEGGKISKIDILAMGETPSIGDKGIEVTIESIITAQSLNVDTASGATVSSKATINAIITALEGPAAPITADATTEQKPAEQKPAEQKPTEQKPAEQKPAEQKPAEQKPAEQKPAEQKPAEQKPAEQKPAEQKPAGAGFKDGSYTGSDADGFYGKIDVTVTIEGGNIKDIKIKTVEDDEGMTASNLNNIINKYKSRQGALTSTDAVSGATVTTQSLIKAVNQALGKAK